MIITFLFYSKDKKYADNFVEVMNYLEDEVCTAFSKTYFGDKASALADKASEYIKALKAEGFIDRVIQKYS